VSDVRANVFFLIQQFITRCTNTVRAHANVDAAIKKNNHVTFLLEWGTYFFIIIY